MGMPNNSRTCICETCRDDGGFSKGFMSSSPTRIGIIGVGSMGSSHAEYLSKGDVRDAVLTAIADVDPARLKKQKDKLGDRVQYFDSPEALLASKLVDGVIIATPHYFHPPIAIKAFAA